MEYSINILWDDEASVWTATSDDIPGFVLESESLDTLFTRVKDAAQELISLNHAAPATSLKCVCCRAFTIEEKSNKEIGRCKIIEKHTEESLRDLVIRNAKRALARGFSREVVIGDIAEDLKVSGDEAMAFFTENVERIE